MPIGFERPSTKFETTFSRLIAFRRRVPLPFSIWSRSDSGLGLDVVVREQALDRLGAHAALEVVAEPLAERAVDGVVGHELLHVQALERRQHLVEVVGLALGLLGQPLDVALRLALGGRELGALGALALELLQPVLELVQPLLDVVVAQRSRSRASRPRAPTRSPAGPCDGGRRRRA